MEYGYTALSPGGTSFGGYGALGGGSYRSMEYGYTALSPVGLSFSGHGTFAGKSAGAPGARTAYTALSALGLAFGGNYISRAEGLENVVTISNTPVITLTTYAPSLVSDNVVIVDYGISIAFETLSPQDIRQEDGYAIDNSPELVFSAYSPLVLQTSPTDVYVEIENSPLIEFEALEPENASDVTVEIENVPVIAFDRFSPEVYPGVFGGQGLGESDINAIFNNYKIDGYSLHELMAGMAAMLMGESENVDRQGTAVYKSVRGDGTVRVAGTHDGRGNRSGVTRTLR